MKIPDKFHNSLDEQLFTHCKMCDKELVEGEQDYLIEKAYRKFPDGHGEELLFEMAICMECALEMRKKLSSESLKNVNQYFMSKAGKRQDELRELSPDDLLQTCLLSGQNLEDMEEYQIYAHCRGGEISKMGGFYLLSGQILEEIQDLLSKETRDELNRFADDNLGTPPEFRKLFSGGDLVGI